MKTNHLKITLLSITLVFAFASCKNQSSDKAFITPTEKKETKVRPPKMDIHTAAFMGNMEALKQHIAQGTDLNMKEQLGGSTPLISAITFGKSEIALALIHAGADVNLQNNEGATALHVASFFCRTEIVKALLNTNIDKTIKNKYGSTALESIQAPFEQVKPIYIEIEKGLAPLGFKLDLEHIEKTRPEIVALLS